MQSLTASFVQISGETGLEMSEAISLELAFLLGFLVWGFSTVAGGGGPLLFLPLSTFLAPVKEAVPITSMTAGIVSIHKVILFWRSIDFRAAAFLTSGGLIGAIIGVRIFAMVHEDWILLVVGLFLIFSGIRLNFPTPPRRRVLKDWHLVAGGAFFGTISAVAGASGQGINILLLNRNIAKENLIATKAVFAAAVHMIKIIGYTLAGLFNEQILIFGLVASAGAVAGNLVGKKILQKMSQGIFNRLASFVIFASGILLLIRFV